MYLTGWRVLFTSTRAASRLPGLPLRAPPDGPDATERLLLGYFRARPPRLWPAEEGAQFAAWLAGQGGQSAGCC